VAVAVENDGRDLRVFPREHSSRFLHRRPFSALAVSSSAEKQKPDECPSDEGPSSCVLASSAACEATLALDECPAPSARCLP
jgi:hypothetical protein